VKKRKMKSDKNMRKSITAIFFGLIMIASLLPAIAPVSAETKNPAQNSPILPPFQQALKESIENRVGTQTVGPDLSDIEFSTEVLEESENHVKIKGTTRIKFDNPMEAGFEDNKWPKLEVVEDPEAGGEGTVIPGDYDQAVKDHILSQIQNIEDEDERAQKLAEWNEYDFESAPRTHIITEVYEITIPEETQSTYTMMPTDLTSTGDVLMGFTWTSPKIDWIIEDELEILGFTVYHYKAGFELDAGLGLRLPTEVTLNDIPEEMIAGNPYTLSTSIEGVNWNAAQYTAANVEPVEGNEYVCYLKLIIDWNIDIDKNYNRDFKTPFGSGEEFPIPDLDLSPDDTGLKLDWTIASIGIGLKIDPEIGSETITADWSANGDATGSGTVEYNEPDVTEDFGLVQACECSPTEEDANIQLSDFKYFFDICNFALSANAVLNIGIDPISVDITAPYIELFTIDMSYFTGGLYLGVHSGTNADKVSAMVPVNEPPVADANGPYVGDEGSPITFDASDSTDPDEDTLQYRWDFDNDGVWDTAWLAIATASHTWCDDHTGTAKVEVMDVRPTQLTDTDTASVIVNNVAPTVDAGPDQTVDEGDTVSLSSSFSDPGWCDSHTATIDWGDGSLVETGTVSEENDAPDATGIVTGNHAYGDNGVYTVTLTVTDDDGGVGTDTLTVTVYNVAPTASISMTQPNPQFILPIVHELAFNGSFTDPGWLDTHTSTWNFGDGTVEESGTLTEENEEPDATGTTTVEHIYSDPGTYTVTLTVTDDDGGVGTDTMPVIVVGDREALSDINDYIQNLPDGAFKRNPSQRKNTFNNMFTAIDDMLG
jgi:PKD repeat protein